MVTCTRCGRDSAIGGTFENVTFVGTRMNVAVTCPHCGGLFDAAAGGDGTFSTVGGRLRRVATGVRLLADESRQHPDSVPSLVRVLRTQQGVTSTADLASAIDAATENDFASVTAWLRENEWLAGWVGGISGLATFLLTLLMMLTGSGSAGAPSTQSQTVNVTVTNGLSDADLERIIGEVLRQSQPQVQPAPSTRRAGRSPARNLPCDCGSGLKYKKCCGQPGGSCG